MARPRLGRPHRHLGQDTLSLCPRQQPYGHWDDMAVDDQWSSLRTGRLVLAPPGPGDVHEVFELLADPRTVAHNPSDRLRSLDEATELIGRWRSQWERHGFGYWCVRLSEEPELVGYCGVKTVRFRDEEALNLVYRLTPQVWGQGLATEAATAVVRWARARVPRLRIVARVRPRNAASQRVALKAGLFRASAWDEEGCDGLDWIFTLPDPSHP